jgi:hypothetical protein
MKKEHLFDDYEDETLWEADEEKAKGKNLRQRKEQKKREHRDAGWAFERDTRER